MVSPAPPLPLPLVLLLLPLLQLEILDICAAILHDGEDSGRRGNLSSLFLDTGIVGIFSVSVSLCLQSQRNYALRCNARLPLPCRCPMEGHQRRDSKPVVGADENTRERERAPKTRALRRLSLCLSLSLSLSVSLCLFFRKNKTLESTALGISVPILISILKTDNEQPLLYFRRKRYTPWLFRSVLK